MLAHHGMPVGMDLTSRSQVRSLCMWPVHESAYVQINTHCYHMRKTA